ncbi:MAG TPA: ABC transporter permease subunit [Spirillospora sp.]|nr:ABC transporter permease subunit [Spirillospora sp.]
MFYRIRSIWQKELLDNLRDRRAVIQSLLFAIGFGIFYAVFNPLISASFIERAAATQYIPTQGIEYADPTFLSLLEVYDIVLEAYEGDLTGDIQRGVLPVGLMIPENFVESLADDEPASLTLYVNPSATGFFSPNFSGERLELAINEFNNQAAARRLAEVNLDPDLLSPIRLNQESLMTPEQQAGLFASFSLPLIVTILIAQSGVFIAIDVTAGEKERGTLEALLVTPASDTEVLVGKLAAVFTFAIVPVTLTLLSFYFATFFLPESVQAVTLPFNVILVSLLVGIPLTLVFNVIVLILAVRQNTFKDAQSAASLATFLALFIGFLVAFRPPEADLAYLIPLYGPVAVISRTTLSVPLPPTAIPYAILGSVIGVVLALRIALRLFNRERLLYTSGS